MPDAPDPREWTDAFMKEAVRHASFADVDAYLAFIANVRRWFTAALDHGAAPEGERP